MTATEFRKAVKEAKYLWGYIRWSNSDTYYLVKLAKADALEMLKGRPGDTWVLAKYNADRKILWVG